MIYLLNDVSRCTGGTSNNPCPQRDECLRYTELQRNNSRWISTTDFHKPGNLFGCLDKIEDKPNG